jgi:hypothetical protein
MWIHCSPALLQKGVVCGDTPRRPCQCTPKGSHDHWVELVEINPIPNWFEFKENLKKASGEDLLFEYAKHLEISRMAYRELKDRGALKGCPKCNDNGWDPHLSDAGMGEGPSWVGGYCDCLVGDARADMVHCSICGEYQPKGLRRPGDKCPKVLSTECVCEDCCATECVAFWDTQTRKCTY